MNKPRHMQTTFRHLSDEPRPIRLEAYDDALMQRQMIEALDYPTPESFDEYQVRVWKELSL